MALRIAEFSRGLLMAMALPALSVGVLVSGLLSVSTVHAAGDAKAGQEKAATCIACHGVDGNSADSANPKIAGQHPAYLVRHLKLFKSGERENAIMAAFATALSEQDMADIAAYYATQKVSVGNADEAYVEKGQALYRGGRNGLPSCMGCHGPSGRGNPGSAYPAIAGQHFDYTKSQLERFRSGMIYGKDGAQNNAVMSQVAHNLTDEEINALSTYVQGLHTVVK
jgi:cytochrome c553